MKATLEKVNGLKVPGDAPSEEELKMYAQSVTAKAVPGAPYTALSIVQELEVGVLTAGHIIRHMALRDRASVMEWGLTVFHPPHTDPPDTTMRSILDASITHGLSCSTTELISWVYMLTGEEPTGNTMRKTLARLVKQERFERISTGQYKKTGRGM